MVIFTLMASQSLVSSEVRDFLRLAGRKGGRRRNPRKGFGSGDNARKAAFARWGKTKKAK